MKIVYKISLFFAVLLSVSACQLDQFSTSTITVTSPEEAFTSHADAKSFANGMNVYFRSNSYGKFAETADIQGDLFNASTDFGNRGGNPHTMSISFNAGDYDVKAVWDGYYKGIVDYNYYIHNVDYAYDKSVINAAQSAEMEQWKGNAYFYRAFSYFELAKKFCKVYETSTAVSDPLGLPIIGKFDVNQKPARATLQVTMDSIEKDITMAATLLASVVGAPNATAPTIDAVNALKARFYLWTKQYQKAIAAADLVINTGKYPLSPTINDLAKEVFNETGTESIMQLFSSITEAPRSMVPFFGAYYGSTSGGIHFYSIPDFVPTKTLVDMYAPADMRSQIYLGLANTVTPTGAQTPCLVMQKFRGNPALTNNAYLGRACKAKVFRIAEMYLIKAEAQVLGSLGDAQATLNALQIVRGAIPTGGTLADVQKEWARETVGEGMRIECLKRWKIAFTTRVPQAALLAYVNEGIGYTEGIDVGANLYKYTWPIPSNDIILNDDLKQNDGWGL